LSRTIGLLHELVRRVELRGDLREFPAGEEDVDEIRQYIVAIFKAYIEVQKPEGRVIAR
jgi:hypothetical protein